MSYPRTFICDKFIPDLLHSVKMSSKDELKLANSHSGKGFSFWTATVFIVGEVAGAGILSLPHATAQAGWSGLAMIVYCAFCAAIAGICLAQSWLILEERYPQYRQGLTRKPFATIGSHAYGKYMSALVSVLMNITRIGAGTVFLLLTSSLIQKLTSKFIHLNHCQWIPIAAAVLLVPLWLGSPADFWPVAYSAMISSCVGTILLIIDLAIEISKKGISNDFQVDGFETYVSAFGTILFAFGGAAAFPNFQNDMKNKEKFPKAVILGFTGLLLLYIPIAGLGYAAMGFHASASIIDDLSPGVIITIVEACFFIHCATVIFIVINPAFLDLEELFRVPKQFNWKRCAVRSSVLILITFIGLSFPSFGQILDLIGSSTIAAMAFVMPPIFYVKLIYDQKQNPDWPQRKIPPYQLVIFALIVLTAVVGGAASAFSVIRHWTRLDSACYISSSSPRSNTTRMYH